MKARIREGALVGHDHQLGHWGKNDTVFDVEPLNSLELEGRMVCRAHGYGEHGLPGSYGNGSVFCDYASLVDVELLNEGGPGSGFYGHAGRPGEEGGSASDKGPEAMTPEEIQHQTKWSEAAERIGGDKEVAIGYASDGRMLFQKKGGQGSVSFEEREIIDMINEPDLHFTHNHPGMVTSFSGDDMSFAAKVEMKTMTAIDKKYIYTLKLPSGANSNQYQIRESYEKILESTKYDFRDQYLRLRHAQGVSVAQEQTWADHSHAIVAEVAKKFNLQYSRRERK